MNVLGFILSLVYMQAVHGWLSTYERLVNSQKFFSPYLTQEDMSRLGRNYLQVGFYTEMLFPQKGVRFIAVGELYYQVQHFRGIKRSSYRTLVE